MPISSDPTPTGTLTQPEDIFIESGPDVYFGGVSRYSPDDDGFYHGITGTVDNPVYKLGCYQNFRLADNVSVNEIRCDNEGVVKVSQDRNYLEVQFELQSLLPLSQLRHVMKASAVTWNDAENAEKMGIGEIDNDAFLLFYFSKVYDTAAGDFVSVTGHRCQFVDAWELTTPYGAPWKLTGVRVRMLADDTKPSAQRFATMIRVDESAL